LPGDRNLESGVGIIGDAKGLEKILSTTAELRKRLMSASGDYRTHMYDPKTGLPPPPKYSHSSTIRGSKPINAIAVSLDGKLIASGEDGGVVQIRDSKSHERIGNASKHGGAVSSICFSPDSRWLVSGSRDGTVRMWDCGTGQAVGSPLLGHTNWVNSVCTDGQRIISGSNDLTIRIWSCDTRQLIGQPIKVGRSVAPLSLSKGRIAAGVEEDVCIFDIETRQQIVIMKGHSASVWTVAFSPNGSRVASGGADRTIRIWDVQTGRETHRLDGHTDIVWSVSFSPDGRWIASGGRDKTVRVWDSQSGRPIDGPLDGHAGSVMGVSFLPDALHLISGSMDDTIHIWSAERKWQNPSQQITVIHLAQQPASFPNNRISLEGHPSVISTCCSPDGSLYAASTLEGHISIWDLDRKLLWETDASIHPIHLLRLSETQLVLTAPDGSSLSWNLSNGRPTHDRAIASGPQLKPTELRQSRSLSNDVVSSFPFNADAGLWAYVDGHLIRFEGREGSITIIDFSG
jgi:WD40 repeat protein